jgi:hypothetical protein
MAPNLQARTVIAHDSIQRSPTIIAEHANDGATADSSFISDQLPALDPAVRPYPESIPTAVEVVNSDSFAAARNVIANDAGAKVSVLNLASDILPAGPWLEVMTTTQVRIALFAMFCRVNMLFYVLGRSTLLFFNAICHAQGILLPVAERWRWIHRGNLFSGGGNLSR